jgi:RNA polymerase sigma factor (sigma-70 family)
VTTLAELMAAAAAGDQAAWNALVARFERLVWATARAHRLSQADAADVAQTTWLRLVENLGRIRDPERLGAWLATTARRESLRHIRLRVREVPSETSDLFEAPSDESPEHALIAGEQGSGLWRAFGRLSERCQALLRLLVAEEEPSYETIGAALGMPVGAIGPTRMRCLEKLRSFADADPAFKEGVA